MPSIDIMLFNNGKLELFQFIYYSFHKFGPIEDVRHPEFQARYIYFWNQHNQGYEKPSCPTWPRPLQKHPHFENVQPRIPKKFPMTVHHAEKENFFILLIFYIIKLIMSMNFMLVDTHTFAKHRALLGLMTYSKFYNLRTK